MSAFTAMVRAGVKVPDGSSTIAKGDEWVLARSPGVRIADAENGAFWQGHFLTFRGSSAMVTWGHAMQDMLEAPVPYFMGAPWVFDDLPEDAQAAVLAQVGKYHRWLFVDSGKEAFAGWLTPEAEEVGLYVYRARYEGTQSQPGMAVCVAVHVPRVTPEERFPAGFKRTGLPVYSVAMTADGAAPFNCRFPLPARQERQADRFTEVQEAKSFTRRAVLKLSLKAVLPDLLTPHAINLLREATVRHLLVR